MADYFGDTCVTSTWYCALKNAFLRSFVDTKTCVGCRSGKKGRVYGRRGQTRV
jgi:hypothetical protein